MEDEAIRLAKNQARQGDVLLTRIENFTPGENDKEIERENGLLILVRGEATGHYHAIAERHAQMYQTAVGMVLVLAKAAVLRHQGHPPITLPPGAYEFNRQEEETPWGRRLVKD